MRPHFQGTCLTGQFSCNNFNCVSGSYRCDGQDDYGDDSDEKNWQNGKDKWLQLNACGFLVMMNIIMSDDLTSNYK
ncbi:hypothetical protein DPMN_007650 [Dreissena polymorpha]|uniref:Uncharacterized protein n=1 Tax=Dreissena polymorpha TaxID=45954 RepID=A0A9D4MXR9_DREPO|nr:hypothetical protein DPMN_007650 [Dreissena polymorpha]